MGRNGVLDSNVILLVSFSLLLPCAAHSRLAPKDAALPPLDTTTDTIDLHAGIALTKSPVGQTEWGGGGVVVASQWLDSQFRTIIPMQLQTHWFNSPSLHEFQHLPIRSSTTPIVQHQA